MNNVKQKKTGEFVAPSSSNEKRTIEPEILPDSDREMT